MSRIRLDQIIATLDTGGAEKMVLDLSVRLRERYDTGVICLTRGGDLGGEFEKAGISPEILGKRGAWDMSVLFRLLRALKRRRTRVVVTHLFTSNWWGRLAARAAGIPSVAVEHCPEPERTGLHTLCDRIGARIGDRTVAVSEGVRRALVEEKAIPGERIRLVWNGIDEVPFADLPSRREARERLGEEAGGTVLVTVGRLTKQKGHTFLLDAFAAIGRARPDVRLWIVGEGEEGEQLRRHGESLGIGGRVRFFGMRRDVPLLLAASDLFVLSSLWEGAPLSLLEAMAAGLPAVVTDIPGSRGIVEEGVTGLTVPPGDPEALAAAVLSLLGAPETARAMGERARDLFLERYTLDRMTERYLEVIGEVLEERNIPPRAE